MPAHAIAHVRGIRMGAAIVEYLDRIDRWSSSRWVRVQIVATPALIEVLAT